MFQLLRTDSSHAGFRELIRELDAALRVNDGEQYDSFFIQHNQTDQIHHVVVVFDGELAVGCGAVKHFSDEAMEVKRMFVRPAYRGKGIGKSVLAGLEAWALELGYKSCVLETSIHLKAAVALYRGYGYAEIPRYPPYTDVPTSVCFRKKLA